LQKNSKFKNILELKLKNMLIIQHTSVGAAQVLWDYVSDYLLRLGT
jgi:hypothetical protein